MSPTPGGSNSATAITDDEQFIARNFALAQNYPNPFNPTTKISYRIPESGHTTLIVYDILGNKIATLVDRYQTAGKYEYVFD